jgi:hypothetical protein
MQRRRPSEPARVKIHQQSDTDLTHAKIGQQLCLMRRDECGDRLDFNDDSVRDQDIRSKPERDRSAFVNDRHHGLAAKRNSRVRQFQAQAFLIH